MAAVSNAKLAMRDARSRWRLFILFFALFAVKDPVCEMISYPSASTRKGESHRYLVVKKNSQMNTCITIAAVVVCCVVVVLVLGVGIHLLLASSNNKSPHCEDVEVVERKWRAAEDRANRLETELMDLRRKHRTLEDDFRDLAISSRSQPVKIMQPQAVDNSNQQQDVSAMQRLAKCRASVEASTEAIRELREHNSDLNKQVTRLQREVKDAIKDAEESERLLQICQRGGKASHNSL
jgi:septal ring factor EnvC (AmiA/AmiB activator)